MADPAIVEENYAGPEGSTIELIDPDDIRDNRGNPIGFEEFRVLSAGRVDAAYFDGGSPAVFPRLGLTDAQGQRFTIRLSERVSTIQGYVHDTPWESDWLIDAGRNLRPDTDSEDQQAAPGIGP